MNSIIELFLCSALRGMILTVIALLVYAATLSWLSAAVRHRGLMCALAAVGLIPVFVGLCDGWKVLPALSAHPISIPAKSNVQTSLPNTATSAAIFPKADESPHAVRTQAMEKASTPPVPPKTTAFSSNNSSGIVWQDLALVLFWVWVTGVLMGVIALAREFHHLSLLWFASTPWQEPHSMKLAQQCGDRTGLRHLPKLHLAADDSGPVVFGFATQKVLLPAGFDAWPEERRRAVLMHEFAHVRRRDALCHFLAMCVCVMHWLNPLVWLLFRRARHEAECACDDVVLRSDMQPAVYADHLLAVASGGRSASVLAPSMARPSGMRRRVKAVLDGHAQRGAVKWSAAIAILVVVLIIGLPVMLAQTVAADKPAPVTVKAETPKVAVSVKFRDAAGKPVATADLRLFRVDKPEPMTPFSPEFAVTSDASGEWRGEIELGEYIALAIKQDLVAGGASNPTYWEISKKDKKREFDFILTPGGVLHVTAVNAVTGNPLANAQVVVDSGNCGITNANGELTLHGVPMGERELVVMAPPLADTRVNFNSTGQSDTHVAARLGPGFEIRGRVTDSNGAPIKGASVKDHYSGPYMTVWLNKCVTDADGNYQLGWYSRTRSMWSMEVKHKDYAEQNRSEVAPPVEGFTTRCDIVLDEGLKISGTVKDTAGKPVKGASVRYGGPWSLVGLRWARSDAEGRFTIKKIGRTEQRAIVAEADGFAPVWLEAAPSKDPAQNLLNFVMQPGLTVKGQIVDRSGKSVPKASVSPQLKIRGHSEYVGSNVWSDADGRFELRNLAATDMTYDVWGKTVSPIRRAPLDPAKHLLITVDRPGALIGKVIDAETKKAVSSFNVRLGFPQGEKPADEPSPSYSAHLGSRGQDCQAEDGRFIIDDLITRARHDVWVTTPGYAMKHLERIAAQPVDDPAWPLEIALERGRTITGTLNDAVTGRPVAGARVFCVGKSEWYSGRIMNLHLMDLRNYGSYEDVEILKTDATGKLEIHLPSAASAYTAIILADGYGPVMLNNQLASNPQFQISSLQPEAKIQGSLAGILGFDSAQCKVWVSIQTFDFMDIPVQPDGSFEFGGLPAGPASLCIRKTDGSIFASRLLTLTSGKTHQMDFLKDPAAAVNVAVLINGEPGADATILVTEPKSKLSIGQRSTDENGRVLLSQLPRVKCEIKCIARIGERHEIRQFDLDLSQPGETPTLKFEFKTDKPQQ